MGDDLTLYVKLPGDHVALLLEILNERFEALQRAQNNEGSGAEKDSISAVMAALDVAARERTSNLSSLTVAENKARQALAQAVENLAHARVVFEASLASEQGEAQSFVASAAIGVEEGNVQRAQVTYDTAVGLTLEARAERAETDRRIAYAQSERAHDEALLTLRRYEPLALEMLKLFSILTLHADSAMADVEAADKARISPHAQKAVRHLKAVIEEHKQGHTEAVMRNVLMALGELELAAG